MDDRGQDFADATSEPDTFNTKRGDAFGAVQVYTQEEIDEFEYRMISKKRGRAIIINNKEFDNGMRTRTGSDVDALDVRARFKHLGFEVLRRDNQTAEQMKKIITEAAALDFSSHDCLACVILTYAKNGQMYGTNGPVKIEDLTEPFKENKSLAGKPKLFFIQACDSEEPEGGNDVNDAVGGTECVEDAQFESLETHIIPKEADFLIAHSSVPGYFSWRGHEQRGSWFIQAFCNVLDKFGTKEDLLTMMQRVIRKVAYDFEDKEKEEFRNRNKQIPCITSMLTKEVFFSSK